MKRESLTPASRWERWTSETKDLKALQPNQAVRILFEMMLINEFEHAMLRLKADDCVWGPVHTSVGQEAVAAATMAALARGDKIAGTHRAHHQFISKVFSYEVDPAWNPLTQPLPAIGQEVVTRTMAEIMGLSTGYCGGRGGSMHLRHRAAGVLGTNAIVAGGVPIATGAAFAEQRAKSGNVVVAFFGDGAINQGALHEACNLAGIWSLPIIYYVENNRYAVGTRAAEATAVELLSQRANAYNMDGYIVEGDDVAGLYTVVKNAADSIRNGGRPVYIEAMCYRKYHHAGDSPGSAFGYRSKDEEKEYATRDALVSFPADLIKSKVITAAGVDSLRELAAKTVAIAMDACTNAGSPRTVKAELWPKPESAAEGNRSNGAELAGIRYSTRADFSAWRTQSYVETISEVTGRHMEQDRKVVVLGEEVASFGGGAYGATKGLPKRFPDRIINTPISECGFVGLGLGAAMCDMRPVVEIMFPDFALVAADQLFNQIAKARHMYGGTTDVPLIARTRIATGCGYGGQHSMDPVGLFALFPGWRIVAPSNAFDYAGLFNTAMRSNDPVVFLEHHALYGRKFQVPEGPLDYYIPFGQAQVVNAGTEVTLVCYGMMTERVRGMLPKWEAAGVSVEVVDLLTLDFVSIDLETVGASLKKTGAVVVVEEAAGSQSIGQRLAALLTERYFDYLDAPCHCVTSLDVPTSVSRVLEAAAIISDGAIIDAVTDAAQRRLS